MKKSEILTDNQKEFFIYNPDGSQQKATIIFTYETIFNGLPRNYVIFEYSDTKEVSAYIFEEDLKNPGQGELIDIETEEEWEQLDDIYNQYLEENEDIEDEEQI